MTDAPCTKLFGLSPLPLQESLEWLWANGDPRPARGSWFREDILHMDHVVETHIDISAGTIERYRRHYAMAVGLYDIIYGDRRAKMLAMRAFGRRKGRMK